MAIEERERDKSQGRASERDEERARMRHTAPPPVQVHTYIPPHAMCDCRLRVLHFDFQVIVMNIKHIKLTQAIFDTDFLQ